MAKYTNLDVEDTPTSLTAASILGIKGDLRVRAHGSTQKAHLILRRVEFEDSDEEDEEQDPNVVLFSLFAQKRIEVKPGKEILLTFGEGPFKDRAVVFEGDIAHGPASEDEEDDTMVVEDEDDFQPTEQAVPPKMRKPWQRRMEEVPAPESPKPKYSSTGVQTEPKPVPLAVKANPSVLDVISQGNVLKASPSPMDVIYLQEKPVLPVKDKSSHFETAPSSLLNTSRGTHQPPQKDRSLSPMELDSVGSTPPRSPVSTSVNLPPAAPKGMVSKTPVLTSSNNAPAPSPSPLSIPQASSKDAPRSASPTELIVSVSNQSPSASPQPPTLSPSTSVVTPTPTDLLVTPSARRTSQPKFANPFVSGGFMTDFVGSPSGSSPKPTGSVPPSTPRLSTPKGETPSSPDTILISGFPLSPRPESYPRPGSPTPPPPPSNSTSNVGPPVSRGGPPAPSPVMGRLGPPPPPFISGSNATAIGGGYRSTPQSRPPPGNMKREDVPPPSAPQLIPNARPQNGPPPLPSQSPLRSNGFHSSNFASPSYVREPSPPSWPPFLAKDTSKRDATPDFDPPFRAGPSSTPLSAGASANFTPIGTHRQNSLGGSYRPPPPPPPELIPIPTQVGAPTTSPAHLQGIGMSPYAHAHAAAQGPGPEPYSPITSLRATMPPPTPHPHPHPHPPPPPPTVPISPSHPHPLPPKPPIPLHLARLAPRHASPLAVPVRADPPRRAPLPPPPPPLLSTNTNNDNARPPSPTTAGTKRKITTPEPESPVEYYGPPAMRKAPSTWSTVHPIRSTPMKGGVTDIRGIAFNSNGSFFAVYCRDSTIQIWDNVTHAEVARLTHSAPVVTVVWMDEDVGVISLCENGTVIKWTRPAQGGHWHCSKIAETNVNERVPPDVPTAMAYTRDRVAVSFMRMGVKMWILAKGTWQAQRSILRQNVVAIKFVEDGTALMGGTKDGVLWYSQVSGLMRAYAFFKSAVRDIEITSSSTHALVSQAGGTAHLVGIVQDQNRGNVERGYKIQEPELQAKATYEFGASFVGKQERIVFGSTDGYALVWDKNRAEVLYGLDHGEGAVVQAVGSCRHPNAPPDSRLITGTKDGRLTWWSDSPAVDDGASVKRLKKE